MTKRKDLSRTSLTLKVKDGVRIEDALAGVEGILESASFFPETDDPDLACVYRLEVQTATSEDVKKKLEQSPLVDFVEEPVVRRLIQRGKQSTKSRSEG